MSQQTRHKIAQRLLWNSFGERVASLVAGLEVRFDTVVRNFSLMSDTNGETWITGLIQPSTTVFDVGFYSGSYTDSVLQAEPTISVVAFDPSRAAERNYRQRLAQDPRVTFESLALSNTAGEATFHDYQNMCNSLAERVEATCQESEAYQVPVTTLDQYCASHRVDHIGFLKIDAEGYDAHVLEGAREILAEQRVDIFMFEFASGWIASRRYLHEVVTYLDPLPYTLYRLFNGFLGRFDYNYRYDSCATRPAMYIGVSDARIAQGDIPIRDLRLI